MVYHWHWKNLLVIQLLLLYNLYFQESKVLIDVDGEAEQKQNQYMSLMSEKSRIQDQLKLSETATTNQIIAAKVLREIAFKAGFNVVLTNLDFNGVEKYEVKGEALSDADVIKYITRVKETNLFENVVLEKSSIATEGSTIKTFVMKIIIKPELINSQLVDSETIEEETSE